MTINIRGQAMSTAYHLVHYRRFEAIGAQLGTETLESLCRKALDTKDKSKQALWSRPTDRLCSLPAKDKQVHLNKVADLTDAVIGEMCLIQQNDLQALLSSKITSVKLSKKTTAQVFSLAEKKAPTGEEFVRGMAYWLAIGNHLFFVKTHGMTADLMHAYLNWLLSNQTNVLPAAVSFILQAEFDKSQVAGDVGDIRSLRVSGRSAPQIAVAPASVPQPAAKTLGQKIRKTTRSVADKFAQFEKAVPVIEALLGKAKTDTLVESLGKGEYLSVEASVKVMGSRTTESRAQMRAIANDLADMTDAKVQVEGKDGKLSGGDAILRTSMPFDLPHEGSNLLEFDNVSDQLREVYGRFVKDGKIQA
jgi:hypothetical protein